MKKRRKELNDFFQLCIIGLLLVVFLGLPKGAKEGIRGFTAAVFSPLWCANAWANEKIYTKKELTVSKDSFDALELENVRLKQELKSTFETLVQQRTLLREFGAINGKPALQNFLTEREEESAKLLTGLSSVTPADVIFRDPSSWSSFLWVNVGENENEKQGFKVIGKNSPVVVGTTLIGVIDYIGKRQSRIRLITDTGLNPAVRVARGEVQNYTLLSSILELQEKLSLRRDLFPDPEDVQGIYRDLDTLKSYVQQSTGTSYLAKGFVYGSSQPLWRSKHPLLKGEGFNYDFADDFGPARDLMDGKLANNLEDEIPLIQEGDLIITSGLDSLFPIGLKIGHVAHVYPLDEGDTSFELEIVPELSDFYELRKVYLLPPYQSDITFLLED